MGSWIPSGSVLVMIRSLELLALHPILWERGEGQETELITDHAYVMKPP